MKVKHLCIGGYPGVGKTRVLRILVSWFKVHMIRRFTSRPPRPDEADSLEYEFVTEPVFQALAAEGFFISRTIREVRKGGEIFHTAIPKIENWPTAPEGTEITISLLGEKGLYLKGKVPGMKLLFISAERGVLITRLLLRCKLQEVNPAPKLEKLFSYYVSGLKGLYDDVVENNDTPEECAAKIAKIAGLTPPRDLQPRLEL